MSQARYIADFVIQSNNIADGAVTFADVGSLYTSNVTENTSLYFTNARATAAVVAGAAANSILFVSSAGVLANSNTLVWTGSNLGIGTGTPTTRLDVVNASGRAARIGGFQFGGTTTSADGGNNLLSSGVYWNGTNLTATQTTGAVLQLANGALQFQALSGLTAGNTYSYAPQMALDSSGNLGIGTGSPSARLHINGTSDATQRIIVNGTGNFSSYKLNYNGSEVAFIQSYQNTELNFGTAVNAPILFYVNNAEQMRLNTTGLGIGTSSPTYKLEVAVGTAGAGQQSIANFRTADSTIAYNAGVQIFATPSTTATSRAVNVIWDADGANSVGLDYFYINKLGNSGDVQIWQQSNAAMRFATNGSEKMCILAGGNVGINQASPRVKLNIDAGIVNGIEELVNLHNQSISNNTGTSLTFSGYNAVTTYPTWRYAGIKGIYDTTGLNSGNWGGQLRFFVNSGGGATEFVDVMTITSTTRVGIGTSSPAGTMHVNGTNGPLRISGSGYVLNPTEFTLGLYNSSRAYLQVPGGNTGQIEIWDGDTTAAVIFSKYGIGLYGSSPPTSGSGITFPSTQQASSGANTLDDYEEGSWTPDWRINGSPTGSWITKTGRYTKVGNMVTIWAYFFTVGGRGSGTGQVSITGLPFISKNTDLTNYHVMDARAGVSWSSGGAGLPFLYQPANETRLIAYQTSNSTSSTTQQMSESNFSASGFIELNIMMTYETN